MPTYTGEWPGPAEWNVAATIELEDDGRFSYSEYWTCYLAASGGDAQGRWSRRGDTIVLLPEKMEGATIVRMEPGTEVVAAMAGETVNFGSGCTLSLPASPEAVVPPAQEAPKPAAPRVAREPAPSSRAAAPPIKASTTAALTTTPSPALSARIQTLINDLASPERGLSVHQLCRDWNALPLHSDSIYVWALRPDGMLLCIDHESFRQDAEPETDSMLVYTALVHGSETYPELAELIPQAPPGANNRGR